MMKLSTALGIAGIMLSIPTGPSWITAIIFLLCGFSFGIAFGQSEWARKPFERQS